MDAEGVGHRWVEDRCTIIPHSKFFSLVQIGACQGDLKIIFQDRRELRKNMVSRSILIPLFRDLQISEFAKREGEVIYPNLKVQKDLYLFLILLFRILKEQFVLNYDEGKGPYTGVQIVLHQISL